MSLLKKIFVSSLILTQVLVEGKKGLNIQCNWFKELFKRQCEDGMVCLKQDKQCKWAPGHECQKDIDCPARFICRSAQPVVSANDGTINLTPLPKTQCVYA